MEFDKVKFHINLQDIKRDQVFLIPKGVERGAVARVVVGAINNVDFQKDLKKIQSNSPIRVIVYQNTHEVIGIEIPDHPTAV